jgi:hypothetical protein
MPNRKTLALTCAAALAATVFALVFAAGAAHGSNEPAVRGAACAHVGEHRSNRSGTEYVCEQRPGDRCPVWHAAHPVRGNWPKPSPCLCPSHPAGHTPSASPSRSKPATQRSSLAASLPPRTPVVTSPAPAPVADQLPVTSGPEVVGLLGVGFLLLGVGGLLYAMPRIARHRS